MDAVGVNSTWTEERPALGPGQRRLDELCRACMLGGGPAMRGLFHGELALADKAMSLASVKMLPGDGLPSQICFDCCDKLESAYKFKLQVEQADSELRERLHSLSDIKDELFFNDEDVGLASHSHDVEEITDDSLLLKDQIDLLNDQKIVNEISESSGIQEDVDNISSEQQEIHKQEEEEEENQQLSEKEQIQFLENREIQEINNEPLIQIQGNQEIHEIHNESQITIQSDQGISQLPNEHHNESFGSQELHEIMLNEINSQDKLEEDLNQNQQLTIHEHDYIADSQSCNVSHDNSTTEELDLDTNKKENSKEDSIEEENSIEKQQQFEIHDVQDCLPNESVRRSKRKTNQQKNFVNRDSDEENYFENLNLSSRLKQVQSEKLDKVYFMCYLCDRQFLSKEVLKEHMHSHEEVRKTLSFAKKLPEKLQKTPEKTQSVTSSPTSSKPPSSGKHPNTCPHCGKEYLYIISFNKHLKQHEKEKGNMKEEPLPLEVSFHEDDDELDFQGYDNSIGEMDYDTEEDEKKEANETTVKKELENYSLLKCNICTEEFDSVDKLKNHKSKHVEDALTEQELNNDELLISSACRTESYKESNTEELETTKTEESKDLKCPHCPMSYSHKKSLARHMESHSGTKYNCKLCSQSFSRKDHLRRHIEQHNSRLKGFKCTQCNKSFGNELTLRNHLIATNHKTTVRGQEYDPNKRIKRVAAKAAQRIIDQIRTDLSMDEEEEEEPRMRDKDRDRDKIKDNMEVKEEINISTEEQVENSSKTPKKFQRNLKSLVCMTCNTKCSSKQTLTKHMELHVKDENTLHQEKMVKTFEESRETEENEEENDDDDDDFFESGLDWPMDSHECPTCKKRYSTKKSLLRHQLLHEEPNFECDICNVKFYRKDKLKAHYDKCSEKNPDQVRKCNICGDTFENNEILREHRAKHVTEGILTEEDLREIEPRPEDKNEEKQPRKRRTDIVGLECTECNKRYTSRKGLLRHIQVHEGKKYLCDICPKKFYRREHLKIHVAKHNMIKPYKCPRCTKRFIKEEQLNNHLTKHERTFKKAKESSDTSKRFLCEICSKCFTQSTTLIAHLRAHNGIKPYVCEVCSRPFTTNAYLKMHMRTHTQERPYICQYCSRAFARADTLANHLTSHTGEAKYHCKYCPKNFRRLKSLKEHVFIHTGQRPYACPTCDRKFNNNGSRYAHSKRCKQNLQARPQQQLPPVHTLDQIDTQEMQEQHEQEEQEQQLQLQEHQELEQQLQQQQRIHQATIGQAQIIKPQNIKTITITRQDSSLGQQHVMAHQEILMPLILPLTVTLTDVGEEVILPEGTKIFTT